jgi:signal transduction histidine kinase
MAIRGAEQRAQSSSAHLAALLEIATLIARGAPDKLVYATVSEHVARRLGSESGAVLRFVGDERAVVVGAWRRPGSRGLPVNAELDLDRRHSSAGQVRSTGRPARLDSYEGGRGELSIVMRSVNIRSSVAAPVMLGDEVWGVVGAATTREEPLPADSEHRLVEFAELVAHAVANAEARRLAAESRLRIVEAGDASRRRLERDLHEGTQQHLLALTLRLRLARAHADAGSELAQILDDALAEALVANAALRELARGIYPIVLTERGLAAALQALIARAGVPVYMVELPSRRYPTPVEATAYFVVAEALAVACSDATDVAVTVGDRSDHVFVEVRGDGSAGGDEHLRGLGDRVAAVGGWLQVDLPPEGGSVVRAEIPVRD